MPMRFVYPTIGSNGLGNTVITLAKAHLISESCQLRYQKPTWQENIHVWPPTRNGYGYYFPTTLGDVLRLKFFSYQFRLQAKLGNRLWPPTLTFTRFDYFKQNIVDIGESCLAHLKSVGLDDPGRSLVVTTSGMWGRYAAIKRSREWIKDLLMSHDETRKRFVAIQDRSQGKMRVAISIKLANYQRHRGYFEQGERNYRIPVDWYVRVCKQIKETAGCSFILVTDGTKEEVAELLKEIDPIHYLGEPRGDLLGLLLMIHSDLVVCSNSTYSRLACFLNDRPYVWIGDTLIKDTSGRYGYLWKDSGVSVPPRGKPPTNGNDSDPAAVRRCFALPYGFSSIPQGLKRYLISDGRSPIEIADDLLYDMPVHLM